MTKAEYRKMAALTETLAYAYAQEHQRAEAYREIIRTLKYGRVGARSTEGVKHVQPEN